MTLGQETAATQHSRLGNPMDGGGWRATVPRGRKELDTTERLKSSSV